MNSLIDDHLMPDSSEPNSIIKQYSCIVYVICRENGIRGPTSGKGENRAQERGGCWLVVDGGLLSPSEAKACPQ